MTSRQTEIEDVIRSELDRYQVTYAFDHGGKHPFVVIKGQAGQQRRVTYPGSPSCTGRGLLNIRSDVRRALREIGAQPWPEERANARIGTLGDAILDAASPTPKEAPMALAHTNGTAPPPTRQYSRLTQPEIVQLTLLIGQNAKIDFTARTVDYAEGWSDQRLLDMLRAAPGRDHLKLSSVVAFRHENFGQTPDERDVAEPEGRAVGGHVRALKRQVADLETRVRALEDAITAPRKDRF